MLLRKSNLNTLIKKSLEEDKAFSDLTSRILIPLDLKINAQIITKQDCVVCGLDIAELVFKVFDPGLKFKPLVSDGRFVKKGTILAKICGAARSVLSAERVSLNFLSHLSGVATLTRNFVKSVSGTNVKILDTRKTTPLLRGLEKYAVRCGGGFNHRFTLSDMVLIKDNHKKALALKLSGTDVGLDKMIKHAKEKKRRDIKIEVEVENIKEFKEAIKARPDMVMLDNMPVKEIKKCVSLKNKFSPGTILEASGNINLKTIRRISKSGVNSISIGYLTHSPAAIDFSLEVQ